MEDGLARFVQQGARRASTAARLRRSTWKRSPRGQIAYRIGRTSSVWDDRVARDPTETAGG
jgi:hypothetical protein